MKLNEYVILRVSSKIKTDITAPEAKATRGLLPTPSTATIEPDDIRFDRALLSKKEIFELPKDPQVRSIAPNIPMKLQEPIAREDLLSTVKAGATWGIEAIGADRTPFTGYGITVAVLDTGIDSGHTAFNGIELVQKDFTGEGLGDDNGHGTHVAGTIFGRSVEGVRIGIASGIKQALIGKVLGAEGGGSTSMITAAIQWALTNGANIISMSLGMDFPGYVQRMEAAGYPTDLATSIALEGYRANINLFNTLAALTQNVGEFLQPAIIIAASGNESKREIDPAYEISAAPPSAAEDILSVGALEQTNNHLAVAPFSNTKVNFCAPGVGIISALSGGGLSRLSGTSMAAPHAAGIAALWAEKLSEKNSFTGTNLTAKLISSATLEPLGEEYDPLDAGMGIVQAPLE